MSHSFFRHHRRHSLVPVGLLDLSEGSVIADDDRTAIEVLGGPPFAQLDLFADHRYVVSFTLDHLGVGAVALGEHEHTLVGGSNDLALRHGGITLLAGSLCRGRRTDTTVGDR